MDKLYSRNRYIRIISFLTALSVLLFITAAVSMYKAEKYKLSASTASERALSELSENLDNIAVILEKGMYSNSNTMLSTMSSQLSRSAACAKVSLGQLTEEDMVTDEIYKFLSQVGDFTASLVRKAQAGEQLTKDEKENIKALYRYSNSLCDSIDSIREGYFDSTVVFEKSFSNLSLGGKEETVLFSDGVNDAEQSLADYPTLIYDGPFADSVLEREAQLIKNKDEITVDEARKIAVKLLNTDASTVRRDTDETSSIPLYCFSSGEKSIGITKQGGYLCYMTNPDYSGEVAISEREAIKRAKKYLNSIGYESMKESYYTDYDGFCTVNFAYEKDGIIYYADLIKVSVRLDTGEISAVDARGYITNHTERDLPKIKVSAKKAKARLSDELTLMSVQKALIPLDTGKEKLCYEMHCKSKDNKEYLVYIDVETGEEDDILVLLYADGGMMTR